MDEDDLPPFAARTDSGMHVTYPEGSASTPFEMFGPDSLASLHRRVLVAAVRPNDRRVYVSDAEIERVLVLHPGTPVPAAIARRRAHTPPHPAGPSIPTPGVALARHVRLEAAHQRYVRYLRFLEASSAPLAEVRASRGLGEELTTPALVAAALAARQWLPQLSARTLLNQFSALKRRGWRE